MKTKAIQLIVITLLLILPGNSIVHAQTSVATGAWETTNAGNRIVMICSERYFSAAVYNAEKFVGACGGSYRIENGLWIETHEFNTMKPDMIGKELRTAVELKEGKLVFKDDTENKNWSRIDDGMPGKLAGAWLITARMEGDEMNKITPAARRTMKILSGSRFQWIAYNVDTKEFFGTGGGTYTTSADGKYTETIEFFSRDNSRVGKSLQFDFSLQNGAWRHKGLSSKGEPIDEIWTKREQLGL